jgi:hypothetical protein
MIILPSRRSDGRTKLLLHCSHDLADKSSRQHGTLSLSGTADYSTDQSKWGPGSLASVATNDQAYFADHADWDIPSSGHWMVECWFRTASVMYGINSFLRQNVDGDNYWRFGRTVGTHENALLFYYTVATVPVTAMSANVITANTWHHALAVRTAAGVWGLYYNGTQVGYTATDLTPSNFAAQLDVNLLSGTHDVWTNDIRIAHANFYNANPVGGLTDTIKPPTGRLRW